MSDLYDKIKADVKFRKEMRRKQTWVSNFPTTFRPRFALLDGMDGNIRRASVCMCLKQR